MIIERPAGSYLQKEDGSLEPDLADDATRERLQIKPQSAEGMAQGSKKKEVKADADTRK